MIYSILYNIYRYNFKMDMREIIILKRQHFRTALLHFLKQSPIYLSTIKSLKQNIQLCDECLAHLNENKIITNVRRVR